MSVVPFGTPDDHAVVMYDRKTQECVIIANGPTHLEDAIAIVNSIKTQRAYIIAPVELHDQIRKAVVCEDMELHEYIK